jgi:uncharacterized membrane protein
MQPRASASGDLLASKERLSALSDGIFAVAMMLLVLDIRLPDGLEPVAVVRASLSNSAFPYSYYDICLVFLLLVCSVSLDGTDASS